MAIEYLKEPYEEQEIYYSLNPIVRLWYKMRFSQPSPPQKFSIVTILKKENALISSPTGSGKTLSAFLSILSELISYEVDGRLENQVYCIYISPLKALANDIQKNLTEPLTEMNELLALEEEELREKIKGTNVTEEDLNEFFYMQNKIGKINVKVGIRTGDTTSYEKSQMLKKPPHILITTPESFAITLATKKFKEAIKSLEWVIADEIHALADSKRGVHLSLSLELLNYHKNFTRIGLSATVNPLDEVAKFLTGLKTNDYDDYGEKVTEFRPCKIIDVQHVKGMDLKVITPVNNLISISSEELTKHLYEKMHELIQAKKITLVFTNTRSGTEKVLNQLKTRYPDYYSDENIGAHHGSLSKEERKNVEDKLKDNQIKVVVSSTSLELGIDIGEVNQVILLGSPKSVARALQRVGRGGHKLKDESFGRIIPLERDDLVEVSTLLKDALEKKIDNIKVVKNSLDILAQSIFGYVIEEPKTLSTLRDIVYKSYCYMELPGNDFLKVMEYLEGAYEDLEDRNVYGKVIWYRDSNIVKPRGKMARTIYLTNLGTIPDQTGVKVKIGKQVIGVLDENFLEKIKKGDIFTLGGKTYEFLHSRGMSVQVRAAPNMSPTIPSWFSEQLPLSFELAMSIQELRYRVNSIFEDYEFKKRPWKESEVKEEVIRFLESYLYADENTSNAIFEYFKEQYFYSVLPHKKKILIEVFRDERSWKKYFIFHTTYGRRVNDVLSRAVAYLVSVYHKRDAELLVNDNGFVVIMDLNLSINLDLILRKLKLVDLEDVLKKSLANSEVLKRRFRHCATRSLMILRSYMGNKKNVGRQQMNSMFLLRTVKDIGEDFPILKEAYREVLQDLMDLEGAREVIDWLKKGTVRTELFYDEIPSPFAFNLVLQGNFDVIKMESKQEFLQRYYNQVLNKIELEKKKAESKE